MKYNLNSINNNEVQVEEGPALWDYGVTHPLGTGTEVDVIGRIWFCHVLYLYYTMAFGLYVSAHLCYLRWKVRYIIIIDIITDDTVRLHNCLFELFA